MRKFYVVTVWQQGAAFGFYTFYSTRDGEVTAEVIEEWTNYAVDHKGTDSIVVLAWQEVVA